MRKPSRSARPWSGATRPIARLCANMHALTRNHARALELLLQARDPAKEDPDLLFNIGMCEKELRNFEGAARWFALFTQMLPDSPDGWTGQAECKLQLNRSQEAVKLADQALALDPSFAPAR